MSSQPEKQSNVETDPMDESKFTAFFTAGSGPMNLGDEIITDVCNAIAITTRGQLALRRMRLRDARIISEDENKVLNNFLSSPAFEIALDESIKGWIKNQLPNIVHEAMTEEKG